MKFYLGVDRANWLWDERFRDVPLFLSHVTLRRRKTAFPRALTSWALDSGGFSELDRHARFVTTPEEYVDAARRYRDEIGSLEWASPQDWMVEPWMIAKTGLSVEEHQRRTVENYLILRDLAPDVPFVPVLQGWEIDDYLRCLALYDEAGVDLRALPRVGIGSVCRRQSTEGIGEVFRAVTAEGIRPHGFGVKSAGLRRYGKFLVSADSMAWAYRARRARFDRERPYVEAGLPVPPAPCGKRSCTHCPHFALSWRENALRAIED